MGVCDPHPCISTHCLHLNFIPWEQRSENQVCLLSLFFLNYHCNDFPPLPLCACFFQEDFSAQTAVCCRKHAAAMNIHAQCITGKQDLGASVWRMSLCRHSILLQAGMERPPVLLGCKQGKSSVWGSTWDKLDPKSKYNGNSGTQNLEWPNLLIICPFHFFSV